MTRLIEIEYCEQCPHSKISYQPDFGWGVGIEYYRITCTQLSAVLRVVTFEEGDESRCHTEPPDNCPLPKKEER